MAEFEEIAHTGGKLTFEYEQGSGLSVGLEHSRPFAATVFQVCINLHGQIVDYVAIGGEGAASFYPQPSVLSYIVSDREGMFGQQCTTCNSYFRASILARIGTCPYCGIRKRGVTFLTKNQLQFLTKYFNTYMEALEKGQTVTVDLDQMVDGLSDNIQNWVYKEERQQSQYRCSKCQCRYDVLGRYALCPACGTPNYYSTYEKALSDLATQLATYKASPNEIPGELFSKTFSEYEALGNCIRTQLLTIPATERRKSEIRKINFQRIKDAADLLEKYFSFRIYDTLSNDDIAFLQLMVNRRHLFIHNAGRVDERYLENTSDSTVRLNEVIHVNPDQATRTLDILRSCGFNLIKEWLSIN